MTLLVVVNTSFAQTLAQASSLIQQATNLIQQGQSIDDYIQSANASDQSASLSASVTSLIAQADPKLHNFDVETSKYATTASHEAIATGQQVGGGNAFVALGHAAQALSAAHSALQAAQQANARYSQPPRVTIGGFAALIGAAVVGVGAYFALRAHRQHRHSNPIKRPRISAAMWHELEMTAAHERQGYLGRSAESFNLRALIALSRLGLIEPTIDGGRRLTPAGWRLIEKKQ